MDRQLDFKLLFCPVLHPINYRMSMIQSILSWQRYVQRHFDMITISVDMDMMSI